ncbi:hypothetical protein SDC9_47779 [bioreactor metagenome]|uniref:Uncharacterized protein n=1 Tax=bioreactor metagenome TaxID=1076179 RepID=A0A644WD74_9ZZZZ
MGAVGREHQYVGLQAVFPYPGGDVDAASARHFDVQQGQVRPKLQDGLPGGLPVGGERGQLHPFLLFQPGSESRPREGVIIGKQNPYHVPSSFPTALSLSGEAIPWADCSMTNRSGIVISYNRETGRSDHAAFPRGEYPLPITS